MRQQKEKKRKNNDYFLQQQRRAVLYIGPPKTASTSIQYFFSTHASNDNQTMKKHDIFSNWTYPLFLKKQDGLKDWIVCRRTKSREVIKRYIQKHIQREKQHHLIMATEWFQFLEQKHRIFNALIDMTKTASGDLEYIVNYRSPRIEQWISIWKQHMALPYWKEKNIIKINDDNDNGNNKNSNDAMVNNNNNNAEKYQQWICGRNDISHLILPSIEITANPLSLVQILQKNNHTNISLIDMSGVVRDKMDISHVIACEIMGVPCTSNGWVKGLEERNNGDDNNDKINKNIINNNNSNSTNINYYSNKRHGDPGLSKQQLQAMEFVFRQRDCLYQHELLSNKFLRILHLDSLWNDCFYQNDNNNHYYYNNSNKEWNTFKRQLTSAKEILHLLQKISGCFGQDS